MSGWPPDRILSSPKSCARVRRVRQRVGDLGRDRIALRCRKCRGTAREIDRRDAIDLSRLPGAVPPGSAVVTAGFSHAGGPASNVVSSSCASRSRVTGRKTCTGTSICSSGRRKYT